MIEGAQLADRFTALTAFLKAHQALWKPRPFTHRQLGWERQYPELAQWLRARSLAHAEAGLREPLRLNAPAPFPYLAHQANSLAAVGNLPTRPSPQPPACLDRNVPGRKWQQIEAFAQHLNFTQPAIHWLDWCAGKGHLGRRLAAGGQSLSCWEYDQVLVHAGRALSDYHGIAAQHCRVDVLADPLSLPAQATPVALHACGDLHLQLLNLAVQQGCPQLAIAPCCYNRTQALDYQPLSTAGAAAGLTLTQHDLALPASEAVTAGARVLRQRDQSMARRLGFDLLQRDITGTDHYLPTPSLPVTWLAKPYADYCTHLAALKGLDLGNGHDWPRLEAQGWERLAQVRNLELLRALFRRPLEVWLVLDQALMLQERGYQVQLGTFCEPNLTPRNLLLLAERTTCG